MKYFSFIVQIKVHVYRLNSIKITNEGKYIHVIYIIYVTIK